MILTLMMLYLGLCLIMYIVVASLHQASKCFLRDIFLYALPLSSAILQQHHLKVLSAGMKTYDVPPDYSGNPFIHLISTINNELHRKFNPAYSELIKNK